MKLTIIESPFAGQTEADMLENIAYAKRAVMDCLRRSEAPIASHLLFTQDGILRDHSPVERQLGIAAGLEWYRVADVCAVYIDRGVSPGMLEGIKRAESHGVYVERRSIP